MSKPNPTSRFLEAVEILRQHNEWRRGDAISMLTPGEIGAAIDTVVDLTPKIIKAAEAAILLRRKPRCQMKAKATKKKKTTTTDALKKG